MAAHRVLLSCVEGPQVGQEARFGLADGQQPGVLQLSRLFKGDTGRASSVDATSLAFASGKKSQGRTGHNHEALVRAEDLKRVTFLARSAAS